MSAPAVGRVGPVNVGELVLIAVVGAIVALSLLGLPLLLLPFVGIAAFWLVGVLTLWRPQVLLMGLLVLYPLYIPLSLTVLAGLPSAVGILVSAAKDALLALLVAATVWLGRDRLRRVDRRIWTALALFVVILLAQALAAPTGLTPSLLSARFHITFLLILPVAVAIFDDEALLRQLVRLLFFAGAALAVAWLSVIGFAGIGELGFQSATVRVLADQGEMGDPINVFGTYLAVILCMAFGMAAVAPSNRVRLLYYVLTALFGWALLSTFSRRAIVGAAVGVFAMAVIGRRLRLIIPLSLAGVGVLAYASQSLIRRFTRVDFDGGASVRMEHVRHTISNLDPLSFFVGHGVGTAGHVAQAAGVTEAVPIHNYYLLLLFEGGVLALGLYLAICWFAMRELYAVQSRTALSWRVRGLAVGTLGAMIAFLLAGLLGVGNAVLPGAPILWTATGAAVAVGHASRDA